jgi:hypothetical protein
VGILHERLGEVLVLFVVPPAGQNIEIDLLRAHCRSNLLAWRLWTLQTEDRRLNFIRFLDA